MARLGRGTARAVIYQAMYVELTATQSIGSVSFVGTTAVTASATIKVPSVFISAVTFGGTTATGTTDGARAAASSVTFGGTTATGTTDGALATKPTVAFAGSTDPEISPTGIGGTVGIDESALEIICPRRLLPMAHMRPRRRRR